MRVLVNGVARDALPGEFDYLDGPEGTDELSLEERVENLEKQLSEVMLQLSQLQQQTDNEATASL